MIAIWEGRQDPKTSFLFASPGSSVLPRAILYGQDRPKRGSGIEEQQALFPFGFCTDISRRLDDDFLRPMSLFLMFCSWIFDPDSIGFLWTMSK